MQSNVQESRMLIDDREFHFARDVSVGVNFQLVESRQQNPPEFPVLGGLEADVSALDFERGSLDGIPVFVHDETVDAPVSFGEKLDQSQLVILPVLGQLAGRRIFAAGNLQGDFHAAVPDVVEILHSSRQGVPFGPVGDASLETLAVGFARDSSAHLGVIRGVGQREVFEDVVVGS